MSTPPVGVPTCYRHSDRETWIRCQRCDRPICPDCMREASVGFQCPECVAEGRKSVRQARTAYGGQISANPGAVSIALIGINVLVWVAIVATGGDDSPLFAWLSLHLRGMCSDGDVLFYTSQAACTSGSVSSWIPGLADGALWQAVTSAFTHVAPLHIAMNMLALWFLGPQIERLVGRVRYVVLYLLSAAASTLAVVWLTGQFAVTVGASGAILGLLAATLVAGRKIGADLSAYRSTIILCVVISLVPGVSWQAHLGGFLGGGLAAAALMYAPRERRTAVQTAGLSALAVLAIAGIVARMVTLA